MRKKLIETIVALAAVVTILTGCVTASAKSDETIAEGVRWATMGAVTGALVAVASHTSIGRAAAFGALALGVPAMVAETLKPAQVKASTPSVVSPTVGPSPSPVYLPGLKEVFISDWLEPEVRWEVIRELRALGYQVSEYSGAPLCLHIEEIENDDPRYVTITYLVDQVSGRILAQGKGEVCLLVITEGSRLRAKIKATIAAIRSLQ